MTHRASRRFWAHFQELSEPVQVQAKQAFERLKADPTHPALKFKPVGPFWSARIGLSYRALAQKREDGYVWFWIGNHSGYDQKLAP